MTGESQGGSISPLQWRDIEQIMSYPSFSSRKKPMSKHPFISLFSKITHSKKQSGLNVRIKQLDAILWCTCKSTPYTGSISVLQIDLQRRIDKTVFERPVGLGPIDDPSAYWSCQVSCLDSYGQDSAWGYHATPLLVPFAASWLSENP